MNIGGIFGQVVSGRGGNAAVRLALRMCGGLAILCAAAALSGCALGGAPILDPKGPVALAERDLLFTAVGLMLIVIIPVFVMAGIFAWRYRAGGTGKYAPDWDYSGIVDAAIWLVPAAIVLALGVALWQATHRLDPYKQLDPTQSALEVEVVAQDWKWLFIYPEQGIASVNELAFPAGKPLSLRITSDTVMNSFFIPALGGQIFAMAGMRTQLNLLADAPGQFMGRNTQYSGDGFADQHFTAIAMTDAEFESWVAQAGQTGESLDKAAYQELAAPSIAHPVTYYSGVEEGLFDAIIAKYVHGERYVTHAENVPEAD
ncbi:ubiquinol oxidase subunit II [Pelagibacterium halotolerans]|uniref:ubiquinol oxidase subunit II n=1 Tax=Pelagibacterium halotolerans TaxID=531813 RepID=UPI00384E9934